MPLAWAQAGGSERIYSGKDGLREEWMAAGWGGLEAQADSDQGRVAGESSVKCTPGAGAKVYGGLALQVAYGKDQAAAGIPLDAALKSDGIVKFYLNEGKGPGGEEGRAAALQFTLSFTTPAGKKLNGKFQRMSKYTAGDTTDGDPKTWEEISIPLADILPDIPDEDREAVSALVGLVLQYTEEPAVEIFVTDCELVSGK